MDLTNAIVGFDQAATMSQVQIAVAGKMLQMQQDQGAAAVNLLNAANRTFGTASDELAAAATGLGHSLDIYA
jgi:hypothetical protein